MGKLVASFVFFLAASALAIREAKPPPRVDPDVTAPVHVAPPVDDAAPPSRAIHDELPPWVRYATPPAPPPPTVTPAPITRVITIEPTTIEMIDPGDIPDVADKCPVEPDDNADNDGCPEPDNRLEDRIILID